jgi:hypothetical protein
MQPKSLAEDYARADRASNKKQRIAENKAAKEAERERKEEEGRIVLPDDPSYYYRKKSAEKTDYLSTLLAATSPSTPRSRSRASDSEDYDTPLGQRLVRQRLQERGGARQEQQVASSSSSFSFSSFSSS